jgi:hypothetical protein
MEITPDLECNVVEMLRSDPIEGPGSAVLLLLCYDLADENRIVPYDEHQITQMATQRWAELLARSLEMAHRLEAPAA